MVFVGTLLLHRSPGPEDRQHRTQGRGGLIRLLSGLGQGAAAQGTHRGVQVTKENSIATAGVLGGFAGLLLGGFWVRSPKKACSDAWKLEGVGLESVRLAQLASSPRPTLPRRRRYEIAFGTGGGARFMQDDDVSAVLKGVSSASLEAEKSLYISQVSLVGSLGRDLDL